MLSAFSHSFISSSPHLYHGRRSSCKKFQKHRIHLCKFHVCIKNAKAKTRNVSQQAHRERINRILVVHHSDWVRRGNILHFVDVLVVLPSLLHFLSACWGILSIKRKLSFIRFHVLVVQCYTILETSCVGWYSFIFSTSILWLCILSCILFRGSAIFLLFSFALLFLLIRCWLIPSLFAS